ncbi:MAG: division/cell wall cluster transcriptional repressor MraZ [Melioribacter sp.]|nr:division/cell wall cluster transcriptional repressor MraZ [Melioribacter sp.]
MFMGSFKYSIDSKGRISIPFRFRKYINPEADGTFIMTRGLYRNIDVYPLDFWKSEVLVRIDQLDDYIPEEATFKRMLFELSAEDKLDSQSRLLIPKNLLEFAGIDKEVFILGQNKKFELWNPNIYEEYKKEINVPYAEYSKNIMQQKKR